MNWLPKVLRKKSKFLPLFNELGPELIARYGSALNCYKGQIDTTIKLLEIEEELIDFAYILYLRDDEYKKIKEPNSEKWTEQEEQLTAFVRSKPIGLKNGDFHESDLGMQAGTSAHL